MGIRRRRKTLTNLLSTMERRVTSVELRPINLLTSAQVAGALAGGDETLDEGPNAVVSLNAPNQYKPIADGYYYGPNVSGKPRVELYFEADPGLQEDNTIQISGINKLNNNGTPVDFDISNRYKTLEVDSPPYDTDRNTYNGKRHTPGSTIDSTALFNPSIEFSYTTRRQLIVKRRIDTVEATTTTAKVVFTSANYFEVGQVVFVAMPTDSPYYGIDGLFKVKEAGSNFITYDFDAPLAEPINVASVTEERYVSAVAQSYIRNGATWFDTSQDPDVAYVWDDYRWVLFGSADVTKDDVKPSPVEDLVASDDNDTPPGSGEPRSRVNLEWRAPTTNENGKPLVDLLGYTVWSRQYEEAPWEYHEFDGPETTWSKGGFLQGEPAYFRVFARDSGGNRSVGVSLTHTTGEFAPEVGKPKAPTATTYLGTIKVAYDDLTAFGFVQAASAKEIEVYFSDVDGFTPGPTNFYGKFPANAGSYIIIPGTELTDGVAYYIKIIVRDIYGNITEPSDQVSITAKISDIVTFDMIDVGTLTGQVIIGLDLRTGSNPSVNGGVIINQQGITAYNPAGGQTFRVNATDGSVNIGSYLGKTEAAGLYLGKLDAENSYATIATANGIALVAGNAQAVASAAQGGVASVSSDLSAVTELSAGTIVLRKNKVVGSINGSTTDTTEINGGVIKTGTLSASKITTGTLDASQVTVNNLNATRITTGTLTGRTIQTASSGQRIVLNPSNNRVEIFASGGQSGYVQGDSVGAILASSSSDCSVQVRPAAVVISGDSVANRATFGATGIYNFNGPRRTEGGAFIVQAIRTAVAKSYVFSDSNGSISSGTSIVGISDERVKKNISPSSLGLDLIKKLNPVTFEWDDVELGDAEENPQKLKVQLGLIAQQVQAALEDAGLSDTTALVGKFDNQEFYKERLANTDVDSEPVLALDYLQLIPVLIKSIQELSARIENLETEREN